MKKNMSASWRKVGDSQAFDHGAWEFNSRAFNASAKQLARDHETQILDGQLESIQFLFPAQFLASLSVELICKAFYLKSKGGPGGQAHITL